MHPALSVIFFTTVSGIGYGLLAWLGILTCLDILPETTLLGTTAVAVSLACCGAGLLSSSLHLGHPERAWRAFSQWRTSWLSREGVVAVVTFLPAGVFGLLWLVSKTYRPALDVAGLLSSGLAVLTLYCTAMIYASLTTIHQWHNRWVIWNYLLLGLFSGSLWLAMLARLFGTPSPPIVLVIGVSGVAALACKLKYWHFIDTTASISTPETATGLGAPVRLLDAPHTEENYLLKEMGFRVARKHAARLRRIAIVLAFVVPLLLSLVLLVSAPWWGAAAAVLAALSATLGIFAERWLFFAEAKHTVTLYYGAPRV